MSWTLAARTATGPASLATTGQTDCAYAPPARDGVPTPHAGVAATSGRSVSASPTVQRCVNPATRRTRPPGSHAGAAARSRRSASTCAGVRVGDCCYLKPHERCSVCGLGRAVSPYASGKATCAECSSAGPHSVCSRCGLDAPASQSADAACLRCETGSNHACRICATPTVSRDSNGRPRCSTCVTRQPRACGGCGRRRVIVRRASGADLLAGADRHL